MSLKITTEKWRYSCGANFLDVMHNGKKARLMIDYVNPPLMHQGGWAAKDEPCGLHLLVDGGGHYALSFGETRREYKKNYRKYFEKGAEE